jgi:hypothetical protein
MKKTLAILFILILSVCVQAQILAPILAGSSGSKGPWTVIQNVAGPACTTSSSVTYCELTNSNSGLKPLGLGHIGIITMSILATTSTINGITGGGTAWNCYNSCAYVFTGCVSVQSSSPYTIDCAYNLNISSADTAITVYRSNPTTTGWRIGFIELALSSGTAAYDTVATNTQNTNDQTPPGVAITPSASVTDVVIEMISTANPYKISSPFSNYVANAGVLAQAIELNVTSAVSAPQWTETSTNAKSAMAALALKN